MPFTVDERAVNDYYPYGMLIAERSWSSSGYRYGYQGYEKDNEVKGDGNSYTTEWRIYDPRLGKWLSPDPLTRKYPSMSPYLAYGGNPILIIDVAGDVLKVAGGAAEMTKFASMLNATFGDQIKVNVAENGIVTMTGDPSKLNANDKALYNSLNTVISDAKTTDVALLSKEEGKNAINGAWHGKVVDGKKVNSLDLYDMEKFTGAGVSPEGLMIHEIWETFQDQVKGKTEYKDAHNEAIKVQGKVDGTTVGAQWGDFDKEGTGNGYTLFTRKGKYYTVVASVENRDVKSIEIKEGWIVKDKKGVLQTIPTPTAPATTPNKK
jgi:RHS repeat-associated protein